jgi:hypothetical protein
VATRCFESVWRGAALGLLPSTARPYSDLRHMLRRSKWQTGARLRNRCLSRYDCLDGRSDGTGGKKGSV